MSETGFEAVTPELALVDPELAEAQRQTTERKAAMSSSEPSNGTFFVDPAQPAPPSSPEPAPLPEPLAAVAPEPAPAPVAAAAPRPASTPMVDVPLGTLIFRAGLLAEEQLEDALQEGMRTGKRLGEVLLERGWLHERDLGRLLAGQKGLPFVEVRPADADPVALQAIPEEKARLQVALPLRYEDGQLVVAVADPSNELVLENLRRTLGAEPSLVVAAHTDLMHSIGEAYAMAAAQQPAPAPEPEQLPPPEPALQQPEPELQPQPEPDPEPPARPEPLAMPAFRQEPELEQPPVSQSVTALPTVLPPAEERGAEPAEVPPLQPLVVEPAAQIVEQPTPVASPEPVVEETQPPVLEQPAVHVGPPQAVEAPVAPLLQPSEPAPEAPAPAMAAPPLVEPLEAQPVADRVPEPSPSIPAQVEPVEAAAPLLEQPPASPAQEPATPESIAEPQQEAGAGSLHIVLLRLREGESLEVGTFHTATEAAARAQEVVRQIATAEGDATWPFFAERYLRPDTIMSVDLLEEPAAKWAGSAVRTRWANETRS